MTRVKDLIIEHCPNGVSSLTLSEVFEVRNGYTPSKSNSNFWTHGTVPWFRMEDIQKNGRVLDSAIQSVHMSALKGAGMYQADSIVISTSATIGEHALITVPFLANQRFTVLTRKPEFKTRLLPKYVYYLMFDLAQFCRENTTMSSFAGVEMSKFRDYRIPIAPVEVQREIVRILDTFTQLEAELEAELKARKTQYEFYRDYLIGNASENYVSLSEVCEDLIVPMRDRPKVFDGDIPWCRIEDIEKQYLHGSLSGLKVSKKTIAEMNLKVMPKGTVIASCSASLGRYAITTTPLITNQTFIGLVCGEDLYNRYLLHLLPLKTPELIASSNSGTIPYISRIKFEKLQIPLPTLETQIEIANILDSLVDLEVELEAESESRRKQKEYYRGKLLNFKQLENA